MPNPEREPISVLDEADRPRTVGTTLPPDQIERRLGWGLSISILLNAVVWLAASAVIRHHHVGPPQPVEVRLVTLPKPNPPLKHWVIKPPKKRMIKPPPQPIVKPKQIIPPKPVVRPKPVAHPVVQHRPPVRPQTAHNQVLTTKGPTPSTQTALPSGNAPVGRPTEHQNAGNGSSNRLPAVPTPVPSPTPAPEPQPKPAPIPAPPPPKPSPPPPPKPTGPTQDAAPSHQEYPQIPDDLKQQDFKSFVRVSVNVSTDGSFSVTLRTSSGNADIDQRVLNALKKWKWKPALQDGTPIASTQRFKFEFEVQ